LRFGSGFEGAGSVTSFEGASFGSVDTGGA
jgi:hypothetical protein